MSRRKHLSRSEAHTSRQFAADCTSRDRSTTHVYLASRTSRRSFMECGYPRFHRKHSASSSMRSMLIASLPTTVRVPRSSQTNSGPSSERKYGLSCKFLPKKCQMKPYSLQQHLEQIKRASDLPERALLGLRFWRKDAAHRHSNKCG